MTLSNEVVQLIISFASEMSESVEFNVQIFHLECWSLASLVQRQPQHAVHLEGSPVVSEIPSSFPAKETYGNLHTP